MIIEVGKISEETKGYPGPGPEGGLYPRYEPL